MVEEKPYRIYVCGNIHCKANGGDAVLRALEEALWAAGLDGAVEVRVSGCQSRCDFGPNVTVWPGPWRYSRLTPAAVAQIVAQLGRDGEPVQALLHPQ